MTTTADRATLGVADVFEHLEAAAERVARFERLRAHVVRHRPGCVATEAKQLPQLVGRNVVLPTRALAGIWTIHTAETTATGRVAITSTRRNRTRDPILGDSAAMLDPDEPVMVLPRDYVYLR